MNKKNKGQEPTALSKEEAIEQARARVSELQEISPGRWCYHIWSAEEAAWIPAVRADEYAEARRKRASTIAAMAVDMLMSDGVATKDPDLTWQIIGLAYGTESTGTVQARVNRILEGLN